VGATCYHGKPPVEPLQTTVPSLALPFRSRACLFLMPCLLQEMTKCHGKARYRTYWLRRASLGTTSAYLYQPRLTIIGATYFALTNALRRYPIHSRDYKAPQSTPVSTAERAITNMRLILTSVHTSTGATAICAWIQRIPLS